MPRLLLDWVHGEGELRTKPTPQAEDMRATSALLILAALMWLVLTSANYHPWTMAIGAAIGCFQIWAMFLSKHSSLGRMRKLLLICLYVTGIAGFVGGMLTFPYYYRDNLDAALWWRDNKFPVLMMVSGIAGLIISRIWRPPTK